MAELDDWDSAIKELDTALQEAATARQDLLSAQSERDLLEAHALLGVEGRNEAEQEARLTLALKDLVPYQDLLAEEWEARARLLDAERWITVLGQKCRLHRAAVQVSLGTHDE